MTMTYAEIAQAFSGHRFDQAYPYLAPGLRWVNHGGPTLEGREAAIEACDETTTGLAGITTRFITFRTIEGADAVVIDSLAEYDDGAGQVTVVASCDIYDFSDGLVIAITSYTVEVPPS